MTPFFFMRLRGLIRTTFFYVVVLFVAVFSSATFFLNPVHAFPGTFTYQGKLTNASNVAVSDASYSIKFIIYDASTGGNVKYTAGGTTGSPTAITVSVTNGFFSVDLGGTGTNSIDPTIFQTGDLYLGVTVASDSEMTPRKQLTNSPFAYNALYLSGLATSTIGGTTNFIPTTGATGNLTLTGTPGSSAVSTGVLYLNPASATSGYTLLGLAVGGVNQFRIDEGGNVYASGTIKALTSNLSDLGGDGLGYRTIYASTSIKLAAAGSDYTFFANTATSRVGIVSSTPGRTLDVGGSFMFSGNGIFGDSATDTITAYASSSFQNSAGIFGNFFIGDSSSDQLTINATSTYNAGISSQSIIPISSNTYDLGSASTFFRNAYVTGTLSTTNLTVTGSCTGCGSGTASGWTDGGASVYLTTNTDSVGIGTTTPNAKLHSVQTTNNVVLRIDGASGQTANLTEWIQNASTSVLAKIDSGGGIFTSSTLMATGAVSIYGASSIYNTLRVDQNSSLSALNAALQIGTATNFGPTFNAVNIKKSGSNISQDLTDGQLIIEETGTDGNKMVFLVDDTGGTTGAGIASIGAGSSTGAIDLRIHGGLVDIRGDSGTSPGSNDPTSATLSVLIQDVATGNSNTISPLLALRVNTVDRLYIYGTSTQSVVFKSLVTDQVGANAFVFETLNTITSGTDRALFSVHNAQQQRFSISAGGNVYAKESFIANSTPGSGFPGDVAEFVHITPGEIVEPGDVLMVDSDNPLGHKKTQSSYERNVAGVVSNTGAFIIGNADNGKRVPMALAGLVYVKATNENGAIKIGDLVVTASVSGHVMRYNPQTHQGMVTIVGMALDNFDATEGKVLVHVRNSIVGADSTLSVAHEPNGTISSSPEQSSNTFASISSTSGAWKITENGELFTDTIETGSLVIRGSSNGDATIGEGVFAPGEQTVRIPTTAASEHSVIFITFIADLAGRSYFVDQIIPKDSFTITLSKPTEEPLRFDWWMLEMKNADEPITITVPETTTETTTTTPSNTEVLPTETNQTNEIIPSVSADEVSEIVPAPSVSREPEPSTTPPEASPVESAPTEPAP